MTPASYLQFRLLSLADRVLHRLRIPHALWWPLCDAYDISLGVEDTPENFPRRHGFVRLQHIYTGSSSHPQSATCQHCQKRFDEPGACLLVRSA